MVAEPAGAAVTARLSAVAGALRAAGGGAGPGELVTAHRALAAVGPEDPEAARLAARAVLCSRREDLRAFDAAWAATFAGPAGAEEAGPPPPDVDPANRVAVPRTAVPSQEPERREGPPRAVPAPWSEEELLLEKDFAEYSDAERARARALMARLAARGPLRRSRRLRPSPRRGPRPPGGRDDLRRTLRAALRYGGEPVERRWRTAVLKPRPLLLVCDVSGSMEPYARMLLQYLHACVQVRRRVEEFVFGTRLTRVTRELQARDPDAALDRAGRAVSDWTGGTRIGASLGELNRRHGRRVARGTLAILLSDGWDRGDPAELGREMARLHSTVHELIWLNPLKARPGYEPLVRGMQAALPHVDHFLAGNTLASLEELAALIEEDLG